MTRFDGSNQEGVYFYLLALIIPLIITIVSALLFKSWVVWSSVVIAIMGCTVACLWRHKRSFILKRLTINDGTWWIRNDVNEVSETISPLESSRLFPFGLMLVYQNNDKTNERIFLWRDVLGENSFRQLSYELHRYFHIKNKSS
ncbi:protein YgfX [Pleionea sediminis]|uniref:protein YgfX n=1 Tax=Pleionea sediminis TaxID=2569479 RepID=UPI00319E001E